MKKDLKQSGGKASPSLHCSAAFWWQQWGWIIIRVVIDGAAIATGIWIGFVIEKS